MHLETGKRNFWLKHWGNSVQEDTERFRRG